MHRLNATEIAVLREVHSGRDRLGGIARAIGRSPAQTSHAVSGLVAKGFLEKERRGLARRLAFSGRPFVSPFREMLQSGYPLEQWLAGSRMPILSLLAGKGEHLRAADIQRKTGFSAATVRNFLPAAIRRALVKKTPEGYRLSRSAVALSGFLDRYTEHVSGMDLRSISASAVMRWRLGFEFIFTMPAGEVPGTGFPTGVTAFTNVGVVIRSDLDFYHYTPFRYKDGIEDHILDCILPSSGSVRALTYSLIVLKKYRHRVSVERFGSLARVYGMTALANNLLRFVDTDTGTFPGFPRREEFMEKYRMYGD